MNLDKCLVQDLSKLKCLEAVDEKYKSEQGNCKTILVKKRVKIVWVPFCLLTAGGLIRVGTSLIFHIQGLTLPLLLVFTPVFVRA